MKKKVILLFGPTGVSKSSIAIELAKGIGEIVSADSMQVYKYMDIGTAKVSKSEQEIVPHHMIDILDPEIHFSTQDFYEQSIGVIEEILSRGKVPFVVGGTGLYYKALIQGGLFKGPKRDLKIRNNLEKLIQEKGTLFLYEQLKEIDLTYANQIHYNDKKRIIRALEVYHITGKPITDCWNDQPKNEPYDFLKIGLTSAREKLYQKIDERCDKMLEMGLIQEVEMLKSKGYHLGLASMEAIGYKHTFRYLDGQLDYEEMVRQFKRDTRRYAKRQWTLFLKIENALWYQPDELDEVKKQVDQFLISD